MRWTALSWPPGAATGRCGSWVEGRQETSVYAGVGSWTGGVRADAPHLIGHSSFKRIRTLILPTSQCSSHIMTKPSRVFTSAKGGDVRPVSARLGAEAATTRARGVGVDAIAVLGGADAGSAEPVLDDQLGEVHQRGGAEAVRKPGRGRRVVHVQSMRPVI